MEDRLQREKYHGIYSSIKRIYGLIRKPYDKILGRVHSLVFKQHSIKSVLKRDKSTAYIIRCQYPATGLMSYINTFIWHLKYAENHGYYPYIDMKNYKSTYQDKGIIKKNVWNMYFEEPCSKKKINKCKYRIYSCGEWTETSSPFKMCELLLGNESEEYFRIIKKYICLNKNTLESFEKKRKKYFERVCSEDKVLGVVIRGTDLLGRKGHAVQPDIDEYFEIIRKRMEGWSCKYVFVASEEQKVLEQCQRVLGCETVIFSDARRFDGISECLGTIRFDRADDGYYRGLEYLETIYMLSKCDCLIGTKVGATVGAIVFRGKLYSEMEILDYGLY